ncbi:MAG TPA: M56 family metallopeptidase [Bacteroidales bacterium]|nr:M56 family metallopeptidase [Bacteroidales bacterium]HSA42474.1 M56 family metallopeptidase [Bacteroidales bacterium]
MDPFLLYLLKVSLVLMLFFAFYTALVRRETFFRFSRVYLLTTLTVSVLLPLLPVPAGSIGEIMPGMMLEAVPVGQAAAGVAAEQGPDIFLWIRFAYIGGLVVFGVLLLRNLILILNIRRKSRLVSLQGQRIYIPREPIPPFTFGRWIFIDRETLEKERADLILKHELVHARQLHTFDIMLTELVRLLLWFHPAVWYYKRHFMEIHEYLADRTVLTGNADPATYLDLLFRQSVTGRTNILFNHFNKSLIKRRFMMMTKSKSGAMASLRIAVVLPLLFVSLAFVLNMFTVPVYAQDKQADEKKKKEIQFKEQQQMKEEGVFDKVENMPEYGSGHDKMVQFIASNIKYPELAKKWGIHAVVYVQFVIDEKGNLIKTKVLKVKGGYPDEAGKKPEEGVYKEALKQMEAEAVRVIKALPEKWKPGMEKEKPVKVSMVLPVKFKLDDKKK